MFQPLIDISLNLRKAVAESNVSAVNGMLDATNPDLTRILINAQGPQSGKTALHRALEIFLENTTNEDACSIALILMAYNPNVDIKDAREVTPNQLMGRLPEVHRTALLRSKRNGDLFLEGMRAFSSPTTEVSRKDLMMSTLQTFIAREFGCDLSSASAGFSM